MFLLPNHNSFLISLDYYSLFPPVFHSRFVSITLLSCWWIRRPDLLTQFIFLTHFTSHSPNSSQLGTVNANLWSWPLKFRIAHGDRLHTWAQWFASVAVIDSASVRVCQPFHNYLFSRKMFQACLVPNLKPVFRVLTTKEPSLSQENWYESSKNQELVTLGTRVRAELYDCDLRNQGWCSV